MNPLQRGGVLLCGLTVTTSLWAGEVVTFKSGPTRTNLLELYTSEGCSSCPPAERWFTTLRQSRQLWKEVVPVSFHVDYWDGLGWTDSFASKAFTNRQRAYSAAWGAQSVYTPGFVLNGAEWREPTLEAIPVTPSDAGMLTVTVVANGAVEIGFVPPRAKSGRKWLAHAALLGFDLISNVKAGENGGRKLVHDFVALSLQSGSMTAGTPGYHSTLQVPGEKMKRGQTAVAAWITEEGKIEPVQAAGSGF